MNLTVLLQTIVDTTPVVMEEIVAEEPLSLWDMAVKGGWLMIPLALMLLLGIYIFVERLIVLHKASKEDASFMNRIKDYIYDGKIESAMNLCKDTQTPSARMVEKGISRLGRPMNDVLVAIENVGNMEIAKLEKGFTMLATIAGGAPMVGFLGTVIGMVEAFYNMANKGDNTINLNDLSGGIYTAMVTTVAGLIVGICAYFAYNFLVDRLDKIMRKLEAKNMEFLDLLNEPAAGKK